MIMSSISNINSSYYDFSSIYGSTTSNSTASADALESTLQSTDLESATDEELMDVCKSFESYFVEQVLKEAKKMVKDEEEENQYLTYFGDTLVQEYAGMISDSGDLGIAKTLYESMKRNGL